ncbi:hemerythrin domain-containing protein [Spirochaetota bacterium]
MIARGLLMIEHRLIEKMLILAKTKVDLMNKENYNATVIDNIVDFIKMYADRTHHGKEEDILFKKLESKTLNQKDKIIMNELIDEHRQARLKVGEIVKLNNEYKNGNKNIVAQIKEIISWLGVFYPVHIKKEDKIFFPNADTYFNDNELNEMLKDYYDFDAKMIHEKYNNLYKELIQ